VPLGGWSKQKTFFFHGAQQHGSFVQTRRADPIDASIRFWLHCRIGGVVGRLRTVENGRNVFRPFEYDYLVFVFAPLYVPYYLVRTRGALGIRWLLALLTLFYADYLLQWLLYAAS
jgi:hypothetical protein